MGIRTTVTLDEDVFEKLKQESQARGVPFREALNEVLRSGFLGLRNAPLRKFKIKPRPMGIKRGLNYDSVPELLAMAEGEDHR